MFYLFQKRIIIIKSHSKKINTFLGKFFFELFYYLPNFYVKEFYLLEKQCFIVWYRKLNIELNEKKRGLKIFGICFNHR